MPGHTQHLDWEYTGDSSLLLPAKCTVAQPAQGRDSCYHASARMLNCNSPCAQTQTPNRGQVWGWEQAREARWGQGSQKAGIHLRAARR